MQPVHKYNALPETKNVLRYAVMHLHYLIKTLKYIIRKLLNWSCLIHDTFPFTNISFKLRG
jgi:hypothetical protein